MSLPRATKIATGAGADSIRLTYEERLVRRKRMVSDTGTAFLLDLPETTSLKPGTCLCLDNGSLVEVIAAEETLLEVTGDLPRLAWHIGNRHTPCQISADRLLIKDDHVLRGMLEQLGATVRDVRQPFAPEGGAYGHGRTFSHSHGPAHSHEHEDG